MPLVIPQNFAHVIHSLRYTGDPQLMAVTYGVEVDAATPPTNPASLAASLGNYFASNMLGKLPAAVQLVQTEVLWQVTAPPDLPVSGASTNGAGPGIDGETSLLPQNSAFLVHKRSSLGGRRGRGRMYFPGIGEGQADNLGAVAAGTLSAWNTSLAAWLAAISGDATIISMVLLHSTGISSTPLPTLVTSMNLDTTIATQRRRLRK